MTDEVLMALLILGLEVIINHIGIYEEDTMGSSVGSFDGTTNGKISVGSLTEFFLIKGQIHIWWDQDVVHEAEY